MNHFTEEEFREKYNLYAKELFIISYGYTKNKMNSEDVIQNVFMKYLKSNKTFKTLKDEKYWLIRVTINESIDYIKSYYHKNVNTNDELVYSLKEESQSTNEIFDYVDKLPKKHRVIIMMFYYEELSINEISSILKISESAVKMRLKRAKAYLKNKMEIKDEI